MYILYALFYFVQSRGAYGNSTQIYSNLGSTDYILTNTNVTIEIQFVFAKKTVN